MAKRTVTQAIVSYLDTNGAWQVAARGAEIEVHASDLSRVESAGAFAVPVEPDSVSDEPADDGDGAHRKGTARSKTGK